MAQSMAAAFSIAFLALLLHASSSFPQALADGDNGRFLEKLQIKELAVTYSLAVDSIGVKKPLSVAKQLLETAFTEDAIFEIIFFPSNPITIQGLDAFVQTSKALFDARNYYITEHMIGTQSVEFLSANEARLNSYFMIASKSEPTAIEYYNGNYTDTVIKVSGEWKISKRILFTFSGLVVQGTPVTF